MALDWGSGFGDDFAQQLPAGCRRTTLLNVSFVPRSSKQSAVQLCIDARRLLCAQIPGIQPDETHFIDLLAFIPECTMQFIDFLSYERFFIADVKFLLEEVFVPLEGGHFSLVSRALSDLLSTLLTTHCLFLVAQLREKVALMLSDGGGRLEEERSALL
jgi:hypothetical protein